MNENSEKYEDILQYEIDALKEIRKNWFEQLGQHTRHNDLMKGAAFGLTFGIVGNLFVQFLYPVIEAVLFVKYESNFIGNTVICTISLILIMFVYMNFNPQLKQDENKLKLSRNSAEIIEYAITRRQHALEQTKKEQ